MDRCEIEIAREVLCSCLNRKLTANDAEAYASMLFDENYDQYAAIVACIPDFERLFGNFHTTGELNYLAILTKAANDCFLDDLEEKREILLAELDDDIDDPVLPSSFFEYN